MEFASNTLQCVNSIYLLVNLCTFKKNKKKGKTCLWRQAVRLSDKLWELFRDNRKSFILYHEPGTDINSNL